MHSSAKKMPGTRISISSAVHPAAPNVYHALLARIWSSQFLRRTAENWRTFDTLHNCSFASGTGLRASSVHPVEAHEVKSVDSLAVFAQPGAEWQPCARDACWVVGFCTSL